MKKMILPLLFAFLVPFSFSCKSGRFAGYQLTEQDAAAAIRQMLELGARDGLAGAFSKEMIMSTVFPEDVRKVLNTIDQLGLTSEIDRFTTTLSTAAENTAVKSIPIFVKGINGMKLTDAMRIIKSGGTAATDYLRVNVGSDLRKGITPVMQSALDEYKLNEQWSRIAKPIQTVTGNRINLDLANLMAGMVSESMFRKLAAKEVEIRTNASARTTPLLQNVFSRDWN